MPTSLAEINSWLLLPKETERLEFKEAKAQYDSEKATRYSVALANEGGGKFILGITDVSPRKVVGSAAFLNPSDIKSKILQRVGISVEIEEVKHPDGRVVIFHIPSRPRGTAYQLDGAYWMRSGDGLVPMTEDRLRAIFDEGKPDWLQEIALAGQTADQVIALLDTQGYFELVALPYPTTQEAVLSKLRGEGLVSANGPAWDISNLGAILLARKLDSFSPQLARKGVRVVIYEGVDKLRTKSDVQGNRGYASGFSRLVEFVHNAAPLNKLVEEVLRQEVKMFPLQALRELIANALVHQDYSITGASVMIEMYSDRVEISNPGVPPIQVERFIDEYRSRNERLADLMRRMRICEEKGSGVDKVVSAAESYFLPAPDFRADNLRTTAILFSHRDFAQMSKSDRIRACYQHCVLRYVSNQRMSNQSLRERFKLPESKVQLVSQVIAATREAGFIEPDETETASTRYARYVPYWA